MLYGLFGLSSSRMTKYDPKLLSLIMWRLVPQLWIMPYWFSIGSILLRGGQQIGACRVKVCLLVGLRAGALRVALVRLVVACGVSPKSLSIQLIEFTFRFKLRRLLHPCRQIELRRIVHQYGLAIRCLCHAFCQWYGNLHQPSVKVAVVF